MQRLFEWSDHPFWEIRGTGLTSYVETSKGYLSDQGISPEKSEALDSPTMVKYTKVVWVISTSLLRNQRHWTHPLWWNMQRLFEWSGHLSWEIRGTRLTVYIRTYKDCLSDQDIPPEKSVALDSQSMLEHAKRLFEWSGCLSDQDIPPKKSEALDSHPMLEHTKVIWVIRTSLLRNQRHWTHILCWNIQRLFEWSGHSSWEIRGTGLTSYVGTCKGCLSDQNTPPEKSEALDSHPMLEHTKIIWVIRTSLLRNQRHWTHILYWNIQRLFEWSGHLSWETRGTGLTFYIETCKGCLSDQGISPEKSEALDSHSMLKHAKIVWVIRASLLKNQRHWTHPLCWNMQRLFEWSEHLSWEIRGIGLTAYVRSFVSVKLIRNPIHIYITKCTCP